MTRIHRICYRTQTHTVGTVKVRKKCTVLHCGFVGKHTFCIGVTLQQNGPLQAHDVGVLSLARSLSHSLSRSFVGWGVFFFNNQILVTVLNIITIIPSLWQNVQTTS